MSRIILFIHGRLLMLHFCHREKYYSIKPKDYYESNITRTYYGIWKYLTSIYPSQLIITRPNIQTKGQSEEMANSYLRKTCLTFAQS